MLLLQLQPDRVDGITEGASERRNGLEKEAIGEVLTILYAGVVLALAAAALMLLHGAKHGLLFGLFWKPITVDNRLLLV